MASTPLQRKSTFYAVPKTSVGRWGAGLIVGTFLVLVLMSSIVSVMNHTVLQGRVAVGLGVANVVYIVATLCGITLSWIAVFAKKDRSIALVIIATTFTGLVILLGVSEFLIPH